MDRLLPALLLVAVGALGIGCGDEETTTTSAATSSSTTSSSSTTTTSTTTTSSTTTSSTSRAKLPGPSKNVNEDFGFLPADIEVDERKGTPPSGGGGASLEESAMAAGCDLQLDLRDEGNEHFTNPQKDQRYETSPPTSGPHFFSPRETGAGALADGAFLDPPPDNRVVHSLEHGRVAIQYNPDLSKADQLKLKGVFDEDRPGVLLFPNPDMPYDVAVTAWRQLLGCNAYGGDATLDALRDFRDAFRGQAPEQVPF